MFGLKICTQKVLPHHQSDFEHIHSHTHSNEHRTFLRAAFYSKKLWNQNSNITIGFIDSGENIQRTQFPNNQKNLDPLQEELKQQNLSTVDFVKTVINRRIKPLVNLNFSFVDDIENAIVRISFDESLGSWSLVGTDCLEKKEGATVNFAWIDVPTICHEICHLLGLIHEHQNPFGEPIDWNKKRLYEWAEETQGWDKDIVDKNIINKYNKTELNGSKFDSESIMLYFFPDYLTNNGDGTQQNYRFSYTDIQWILKTYPPSHGKTASELYKEFYGVNINRNRILLGILIVIFIFMMFMYMRKPRLVEV